MQVRALPRLPPTPVVTGYLYDAEGRLCAAANYPYGGVAVMTGYLYDADGTRVAKGTITSMSCDPAVNGFQTTTDYVLGLGGEQVTEVGVDANGTLAHQHTNVWAGGKLLATYDNDGLHFYLDDPLGTRRVQTNYAGAIEQQCSSLPFGDGESCTATPTEHLFTGKERDTETGNDYFGARYYASTMGRWMSPDSSGYSGLTNPQSWNLFSYTLNNPLRFDDPTGHTVENTCGTPEACMNAVRGSMGNAEAASRLTSKTTVTKHKFLGIFSYLSSKTTIGFSGDEASFRALSPNASHFADLVNSKDNFTVDIRNTYFDHDRQGAWGTSPFINTTVIFAGGFTQGPSLTGSADGNVYVEWNPGGHDQEAADEGIPRVNSGEAMAHELLGHLWGEVFGGHAAGTQANKQDAVNAENVVRATDPSRKQKASHDHGQVQLH